MTDRTTRAQRRQRITALLIDKKKELLSEISRAMGDRLNEDVRLVFETAQDNPDRSVDDLLKHVSAAVTGSRSEDIDKIDAALLKLRDGTYGICEECGCEIPLKRLEAVLFAVHCVRCQHELDRQSHHAKADRNQTLPEPAAFDDDAE